MVETIEIKLLLYKSGYPLDSLVRFGWEIGTYTILKLLYAYFIKIIFLPLFHKNHLWYIKDVLIIYFLSTLI